MIIDSCNVVLGKYSTYRIIKESRCNRSSQWKSRFFYFFLKVRYTYLFWNKACKEFPFIQFSILLKFNPKISMKCIKFFGLNCAIQFFFIVLMKCFSQSFFSFLRSCYLVYLTINKKKIFFFSGQYLLFLVQFKQTVLKVSKES